MLVMIVIRVAIVCVYKDLPDAAARKCSTHGNKNCPLPPNTHGAIGGISCRDFSKNRTTGEKCPDSVYSASSSPGKSADCMHGFVGMLEVCPPDWFVVENSDELAENAAHQESLDLFCHDIGNMGYDLRVYTANASDFGLPQNRWRAYIVGVRRPLKHYKMENYDGFFTTIQRLLIAFHCAPPPLAKVLYDDDDPRVTRERERRQAKGGTHHMTSKELDEQRKAWRALGHRHLPGTKLDELDCKSPWWDTMCLRKRGVVEIKQYQGRQKVEGIVKKLEELTSTAEPKPEAIAALQEWVECLILLCNAFSLT